MYEQKEGEEQYRPTPQRREERQEMLGRILLRQEVKDGLTQEGC